MNVLLKSKLERKKVINVFEIYLSFIYPFIPNRQSKLTNYNISILDFKDAQQNTLDTKVLRIYPPNDKSLRVEGLCRGRGFSESTSHLTKNIQKWKSVGSGNFRE